MARSRARSALHTVAAGAIALTATSCSSHSHASVQPLPEASPSGFWLEADPAVKPTSLAPLPLNKTRRTLLATDGVGTRHLRLRPGTGGWSAAFECIGGVPVNSVEVTVGGITNVMPACDDGVATMHGQDPSYALDVTVLASKQIHWRITVQEGGP